MKQNKSSSDVQSGNTSFHDVFKKALKSKSEWPDKDELLDVIYWARQIIGTLIGICWGLIPFTGILGVIIYLALTTFAVHLYATNYQNMDEEKLGGFWELAKEGFGSSFASFLIAWILVYTAVHAS